jgi:hypothetical protein
VQVMMVIMVPDKRHVEIIRSQVDAKRLGWQSAENNAGKCGNPQNSADPSHDLAPLEALKGRHPERHNNVKTRPSCHWFLLDCGRNARVAPQ